ncbi:hypothetical protein DNTS_021915 [Danionella cerebrum]|uniref:Domain of unknown function with conserved HDNR motif domain-containing protein n=1 Tax=Danionella cerebrum TaxID=2873325 RepID=A0A553QP92_9TELE|nr:hypothetical protein DNTS_021915 [Danionella translucida]
MSNGGKRYFKKNKSGNWFVHSGASQECDFHSSTALAHSVSQPMTQAEQRYPKGFTSLQRNCIDVYDQGTGRKKCLAEIRQHNSHYSLCHHPYGTQSPASPRERKHSVYQTDFLSTEQPENQDQTMSRRFPRDHSARSQMKATAQAGERFMWFGRNDSKQNTPLSVLASANLTLTP